MPALDWAAAMTVIVVWAFNFIAGKVGVNQIPPLLLLSLRFALVAVLLTPFLRRLGPAWPAVALLSLVLGFCHFGLLFVGLEGVNAGPAAIAIQLTVPFSAMLAFFVYGERLGRWQWLGMAVAFVGVYLLAGEPAARPSPVHFLFVVGGAFAWSVANILIKRLGPIGVFSLNGWLAWLAWPQLLIVSVVVESGHRGALINADWTAWAAIAYMALGASITAYGLWYHLVRRHEINRIVPLTLLSPVLAVALAVVLLDEAFTARIAGGGVVTLLGVAMILFLRPRPVVAGAPVSSP